MTKTHCRSRLSSSAGSSGNPNDRIVIGRPNHSFGHYLLWAILSAGMVAALLGGVDILAGAMILFFLAMGLAVFLRGTSQYYVEGEIVHGAERRYWWSSLRVREWPVSEFECVRVNFSTTESSVSYEVSLFHMEGQNICITPNSLSENQANEAASDAARAMKLSIEWAKIENPVSENDDYETWWPMQ